MTKGLNAYMRALHQAAYDYVWDRWGIYVGTFRMGILLAANVNVMAIALSRAASGDKDALIVSMLDVILQAAIVWLLFGLQHLGREWALQDKGKIEALNANALRMQSAGPFVRLSLLMVCALAWYLMDIKHPWASVSALAFMLVWTYSREVMVRERDPDRFKAMAPQAT